MKGQPIPLPPNPASHITEWWLEIGPTSSGMSEGPITWQEIDAWCNRTGIDLDPWESRTIRRLSKSYAAQKHNARKPACPSPYSTSTEPPSASALDQSFAGLFTAAAALTNAGS